MPISRYIVQPVAELARQGKLSGILLVGATALSMCLANGSFADSWLNIWETEIGFSFLHKSLLHWINDGLMVLFFLLVGLEIRREIHEGGEISTLQKAIMPVFAAAGGMLAPALIYLAFNFGSPETLNGWAIPTATDIAFSLGILSLLGKRVPLQLKVFLTALAIIDDIGAILIIAFFYSSGVQLLMVAAAAAIFACMLLMRKMKVGHAAWYVIPGLLLWYFILKSGIHPTIAGVLTAFALPFQAGEILEEKLGRPVNYMILPLFALANTAIVLTFNSGAELVSPMTAGILLGLFIGKPLGILLFYYLPGLLGIIRNNPAPISFRQIAGLGFTAGIGFTMSIFISVLSFPGDAAGNMAKLAIIAGSMLSALAGILLLARPSKGNGNRAM